MNRTPAFLCQWHHCRTLHTGQYSYDFFQFVFWSIHQYIFFIFSCFYCVHTEQQFFEHFFFLFAHVLVANQQCFITTSTSFKRLLTKVEPELTISKMASANPIPGDTSTEPVITCISAFTLFFFRKLRRITG
jgi:hypothetical protein